MSTPSTGHPAGHSIDRRALVSRHAVRLDADSPELVLTLGNGDFAFSADVTGLQTLATHDPSGLDMRSAMATRVVDTGTQSTWGWHEQPNPEGFTLADTMHPYATARGEVLYPDSPSMERMMAVMTGQAAPEAADLAGMWLGANPHRLDLGRLGLLLPDGPTAGTPQVDDVDARLDLWAGRLDSTFTSGGERVEVTTAVAGEGAVLATRVTSTLLAQGRAALRLALPDPSPEMFPGIRWGEQVEGTVELEVRASDAQGGSAVVTRRLDSTTYTITLTWTGAATASHDGGRTVLLTPAAGTDTLEVVAAFAPVAGPGSQWYEAPAEGALTSVDAVLASAAAFWEGYWASGAAVELAGSQHPRAAELERRLVLSQYLLRANGGGLMPPQETGLISNTWRGKFHLEMHWWHAAQFAAWGRPEVLERSFGWYRSILPSAQATAAAQGCRGARWPKEVGPDGHEAPGSIGPFLVWQQPHLLYLAELCWAAYGTRGEAEAAAGRERLLATVGDLLDETAELMASFPQMERTAQGSVVAHLGAPVMPAQEFYDAAVTRDPTYELAYWWFGLELAQRFRERRGLGRVAEWEAVQAALPVPEQVEGRYTAVAGSPSVRTDDHPSFLQGLGFLPPTPLIDPAAMGATLDWVREVWDWDSTWGWDYPVMAMTATRLGRRAEAVDLLMQEGAKNRYDAVGHNPAMGAFIPLYLPGNGGLLAAVALMAAGWEGSEEHPGFGEGWDVRAEGLTPWPL